MTHYSEIAHRLAAQRLVEFAQSDGIRSTLRKYGPYLKTENGRLVWRELANISDDLLCGVIEDNRYSLRVATSAIWAKIPLEDFRIIAWLSVEFGRCIFFGAGDAPIRDVGPFQGVGG